MTEHAAQILKEKLEHFASGLTPEESAQLHRLQTDDVTGMLSTSLWDKAQRVADGLTQTEQGELAGLLERAGLRATAGEESDTEGYMNPLYDDGEGSKGRPRPQEGAGGGGDLSRLVPQPYRQLPDMVVTAVQILPTLRNISISGA